MTTPIVPDTFGQKFSPLSNLEYSIPKGQAFFKPNGSTNFHLLGDLDVFSLELKIDLTDRYTNEAGRRTLVKSITNLVDATATMTLVQLSDYNRSLALMGDLGYDTQTAVSAHVQTITGTLTGSDKGIYELDNKNVVLSTVVVTDDAISPVAYVLGTNYKIDAAAGYIQILSIPGGATANTKITYDTATVAAADLVSKVGIAANANIIGALVIRGTNEVGTRTELHLHQVQLHPNKARDYIAEKDLAKVELIGRVFSDPTQAAGFELGYERKIV